jgi:hypothetical protein
MIEMYSIAASLEITGGVTPQQLPEMAFSSQRSAAMRTAVLFSLLREKRVHVLPI